jgi:hypothetical protein
MDMGLLSLGAFDQQSWGSNHLPHFLAWTEFALSDSWSLHIGSVTMDIPGSLIFGGYDSTGVIGEFGTCERASGL